MALMTSFLFFIEKHLRLGDEIFALNLVNSEKEIFGYELLINNIKFRRETPGPLTTKPEVPALKAKITICMLRSSVIIFHSNYIL